MNKQRIMTFLGMAVIGVGVWSYFSFQGQILGNAAQFGTKVIVAKNTVPVGTILTNDEVKNDFQFEMIPKNYVANGAITDPTQLVGMKVNATVDVNQQITNNMLDSHVVKLGKDDRLFSFSIDWTRSVGADVFSGDLVDIDAVNPKTGQTSTVINAVPIYKVQDQNGVEITRSTMVQTQNGQAHVAPALITVAANPQMIQALEQAQANGQLFLVKYGNENMPK